MEYTDIFVNGSVDNVKQAVQRAFEYNKFATQWRTEFAGKATRGSQGKNFLFGGFSQYYEIEFQIWTAQDGALALRLMKMNSGWMGGALGAHKVAEQYNAIVNGLSNYFQSQGIYRGRYPP